MAEVATISRYEVLKNRKEILENPLPFHHHYFEKYGHTFKIDLGAKNKWVFTRNPETIKYFLQTNHKNYQKSTIQTEDLGKYVGKGLLTSNGEFWRKHRRIVQPTFHKKKLLGLFEIMHKAIKKELDTIRVGEEQEIVPKMGDLAFQVVAKSLFSAADIRNPMQRLKDITAINQKMIIKEMRLPYLKWWFLLKGEIKRHLALSEESQKLLNGIIQERVDSSVEKNDLLDMLLSATYEDGSPMPREQLIDEVLILFVAGHETTANALSFTLLLLAKHPEIQDKLFEEVNRIDFSKGDFMEQLGQLVYTKQCLEESLRLYPPAYFFDRASIAEDIIDGTTYPEKTVWLISIYELHRLESFWENPNEFNPERFGAERKKDWSAHYYPFGAGPRMCIGNNFAMYEMMMTIAILVKMYHVSTSIKEIEVNPLITLKPKRAPIKFEVRRNLDVE